MEIRLVLLGSVGVGKSALNIQFVGKSFVEEYDPTIEDYFKKQVEIDGEVCLLDILGTAGLDQYHMASRSVLRHVEGFLFVYSITDRESFVEIDRFVQHVIKLKPEQPFSMMLVGSKVDLESERQVSTKEGLASAQQQYGCPFVENFNQI
eukprot:TRINITY_DN1674_c0_g1_i4.p1 TRINITY_DN1674_c0_g1~~TRINITY_DN1674_c0_g1_i4.p1  ORF type:complete len:150 (-),score=33.05 TRINITY_DN1674_c0_g1_i4:175-624(-)